MTQDPFQILSTLIDGEPVAPDVLAAALLAPGAREALVDFVRLRAEIRADESRPSPRLHAAIDHMLGRPRRPRRVMWRVLQGAAAAVVLALAALGASNLPSRFQAAAAEEPPRAGRVLRFTPGVDWHEGGP
jgi:hypothetical protein